MPQRSCRLRKRLALWSAWHPPPPLHRRRQQPVIDYQALTRHLSPVASLYDPRTNMTCLTNNTTFTSQKFNTIMICGKWRWDKVCLEMFNSCHEIIAHWLLLLVMPTPLLPIKLSVTLLLVLTLTIPSVDSSSTPAISIVLAVVSWEAMTITGANLSSHMLVTNQNRHLMRWPLPHIRSIGSECASHPLR